MIVSQPADVPADFAPLFRTSPFLDAMGPLYGKGSGARLVVGFRVAQKHTNARGTLHGGVLAALADVALGYSIATSTDPPARMVTVSLSVDFSGAASPGDWVETSVDIQTLGKRLAFANAYFQVAGERIARASAVFQVVSPPVDNARVG